MGLTVLILGAQTEPGNSFKEVAFGELAWALGEKEQGPWAEC